MRDEKGREWGEWLDGEGHIVGGNVLGMLQLAHLTCVLRSRSGAHCIWNICTLGHQIYIVILILHDKMLSLWIVIVPLPLYNIVYTEGLAQQTVDNGLPTWL